MPQLPNLRNCSSWVVWLSWQCRPFWFGVYGRWPGTHVCKPCIHVMQIQHVLVSVISLRSTEVIIESWLFVSIIFRLSAKTLAKLWPSFHPRCCVLLCLEKWCYCISRMEKKHHPECPFSMLNRGFPAREMCSQCAQLEQSRREEKLPFPDPSVCFSEHPTCFLQIFTFQIF